MNARGFAAAAAMKHDVPVDEIFGVSRKRRYAKARWDAWKLARAAGWSLMEIAEAFGRDHTTIMHGLRK